MVAAGVPGPASSDLCAACPACLMTRRFSLAGIDNEEKEKKAKRQTDGRFHMGCVLREKQAEGWSEWSGRGWIDFRP